MVRQLRRFQALLTKPASIERVKAQQPAITRIGGSIRLRAGNVFGQVSAELALPTPYQPEDFFPELPFFPTF